VDVLSIAPGELWDASIAKALEAAIGLLVFVSQSSVRSDWVSYELQVAGIGRERLIIPVRLDNSAQVPLGLAKHQWLDYFEPQIEGETEIAARKIVASVKTFLEEVPHPKKPVKNYEAPAIAADIAQNIRSFSEPAKLQGDPSSVFVVHGHNLDSLEKVEEYLTGVGVEPIILSRRDESSQSLFQKFMSVAAKAKFAIVLLGGDDYGASRRQYDLVNVADKSLQFRARQNVILELGFFYGRLGFENVFVFFQEPDIAFPNFERPSDLDGVIFDSMSDISWQRKLRYKLSQAGFKLNGSDAN